MKKSSKELLLQLAAEHDLVIMGHSNFKDSIFKSFKSRRLPKIYTAENINELQFPEAPVFLVKKRITVKKFLGISWNVVAYTICAMFIESHRVQAYVYGEEYQKIIGDITDAFSEKVGKTYKVTIELDDNPGTEYFFPKRKIKNGEGYLGSGYLRIQETPGWVAPIGIVITLLCLYVAGRSGSKELFLLSPFAGLGFITLFERRTKFYRTTRDHFKSAVVRKQLIDLEPLSEKIDKEGYVAGFD